MAEATSGTCADAGQRVGEAAAALAKLEAIPHGSRECVPDFERRVAEARDARDAALRDKQAAKPWLWRLKGAEKADSRADKAVGKCTEAIAGLEAQLEAMRAELVKARLVKEETASALAGIRAEVAANAGPFPGEHPGPDSAVTIAAGLASQFEALAAAAAAGNGDVAWQAMRAQVAALQRALPAPCANGEAPGPQPTGAGAAHLHEAEAPRGHCPPGAEEAVADLVAAAETARSTTRPGPY